MNYFALSAPIVGIALLLLWTPVRKLLLRCLLVVGAIILFLMGVGLAGHMMPELNVREALLLKSEQAALTQILNEEKAKEETNRNAQIATDVMISLESIYVAPEATILPLPPHRKPKLPKP
jgi:hypothetical protein